MCKPDVGIGPHRDTVRAFDLHPVGFDAPMEKPGRR
jgi:hypothetical protein